MYYPLEPTKCPKCGATVKVDMSKAMLSHPPCYEWTCPNCGEKGYTKQGDVIALENQVFIEATTPPPKTRSCDIPEKPSLQQGWECPRCGAILAPYMPYCPFCSKKESDWITTVGTGTQPFYAEWTNRDNLTPPTGQYTNPNPSITVLSGDILKVADSCTHTSALPCNNIKATL